jgi:hypothetical protein
MRSQRIDSRPSTTGTEAKDFDQSATEAAIMALLLSSDHHGLWMRSELVLEVSASPLGVEDALAALHGSGLLHLQGELVIASRAAQRMDTLEM